MAAGVGVVPDSRLVSGIRPYSDMFEPGNRATTYVASFNIVARFASILGFEDWRRWKWMWPVAMRRPTRERMASPSLTVFLSTTPTRKPIARTINAATIAPDPTSNTDDREAHFDGSSAGTLKLS